MIGFKTRKRIFGCKYDSSSYSFFHTQLTLLGGQDLNVTLCSKNTLLQYGQKQYADRWGLRLGAGNVHAYLSVCMHGYSICACVCVLAHSHVCPRGVWGGSSGASSVSVPSATPLCWHPREWQKGWRIHFGKKGSGSSGLMGNNVGFTDGKMQRTPAERAKPINQFLWQNSWLLLSRPSSACLIRHSHSWNDAANEEGVHRLLHTQTLHTPRANVSLMHGRAVVRGLIGYINTNTSLERQEGKGAFCAIRSVYC